VDLDAPITADYNGRASISRTTQSSLPGDFDKEGTLQFIRIDRVKYSDGSHPEDCPGGVDLYPVEPDGYGQSLTRKIPTDYGKDPENWIASVPSPDE
jgi:hypothetical protein